MSSPFDKITVDIAVSLGSASIPIHQLLRMGRGAVIDLGGGELDDVEILANNVPVARGQVVVRGERIGITVTEILLRGPDARAASDRVESPGR